MRVYSLFLQAVLNSVLQLTHTRRDALSDGRGGMRVTLRLPIGAYTAMAAKTGGRLRLRFGSRHGRGCSADCLGTDTSVCARRPSSVRIPVDPDRLFPLLCCRSVSSVPCSSCLILWLSLLPLRPYLSSPNSTTLKHGPYQKEARVSPHTRRSRRDMPPLGSHPLYRLSIGTGPRPSAVLPTSHGLS